MICAHATNATQASETDAAKDPAERNPESGTTTVEVGHLPNATQASETDAAKDPAERNPESGTMTVEVGHSPARSRSQRRRMRKRMKAQAAASTPHPKQADSPQTATLTDKVGHDPADWRATLAYLTKAVSQACDPRQDQFVLLANEAQTGTFTDKVGHADSRQPKADSPQTGTSEAETGTFTDKVGHADSREPKADHPETGTSTDKVGQADNSQTVKFSVKKQAALDALLLGKNATQTAQEIGVDRRTITRWKQEPDFQAKLHRGQRYVASKVRARVVGLADDAVETIAYWVKRGHIPTALELLNTVQVFSGEPLETVDETYAKTTPDAAAPFTQRIAYAPLTEENSTPDNRLSPVEFVVPQAALPAAPESGEKQTAESRQPALHAAETTYDLADLSLRQQHAMAELLAGNSLAEAAQVAHVSYFTLERWLHCDRAFRQVLRDCRREQTECLQTKLLNLCMIGAKVLKIALKQRRDRRVAFAILRWIGAIK